VEDDDEEGETTGAAVVAVLVGAALAPLVLAGGGTDADGEDGLGGELVEEEGVRFLGCIKVQAGSLHIPVASH